MLVHEAILDVAIGAAQFRGEDQGGMPTLGCPRCNGEPMGYNLDCKGVMGVGVR